MLHFQASTGSTNDDARSLAAAGAPHGTAVLALRQTAGRGRLGRRWESEAGGNVYLSVVLRRAWRVEELAASCLAAAVATARVAGPAYRIKWPNDVQDASGRKVAGLLAEAEWEGGLPRFVVLGVGVNVHVTPDLPTAGRLADDGVVREPRAFAERLLEEILAEVERPTAEMLAEWRSRSATLGRRVRVGGVTGVAEDVDQVGALLVRVDGGGLERVLAGDVELIGSFR